MKTKRQTPVFALLLLLLTPILFTFLNHDINNLYNEDLGITNEALSSSSSKICNKNLDVTRSYGVHILPVPP